MITHGWGQAVFAGWTVGIMLAFVRVLIKYPPTLLRARGGSHKKPVRLMSNPNRLQRQRDKWTWPLVYRLPKKYRRYRRQEKGRNG